MGFPKAAMVSMDCFALTSAINIDENINIGRLDPATRPSSWTALIEPYRVSNSRIQKDTPPCPDVRVFQSHDLLFKRSMGHKTVPEIGDPIKMIKTSNVI